MKKPKIIALIPARGGSKTIPKKNIKMIAGKPLLAWTIEKAKESKYLNQIIVSTEDKEIAKVAKKYGAEVLDRPKELATDNTDTWDVIYHTVKNIDCDIVVLLQCTSPIRKKGLIDECIKEFSDKKCDSLATGFYCKYLEYGKFSPPRQKIKGFFYNDGNIYIVKTSLVIKGKSLGEKVGKKICKKVISKPENIEIDNEFDFWLTEKILLEKNNPPPYVKNE